MPPSVALIGFLIPVGLGLVFGLIGGVRLWMCRNWVRTSGMVINSRTGGITGFGSMYPTFEWIDQYGRRQRKTSAVRQSFAPQPGTRVSIKYDPERPHRGMINTFVQNGSIFILVAGLLVVLGLIVGVGALWLTSLMGPY